MKKYILSLVMVVLFAAAYGQTYNPSLHTVSNKPYGLAQSGPLDARSYFYDPNYFKYRPYQSVAEVLTYLNQAKYRTGNFPIYINTGGWLSAGVFTGGTISEYWFKDGTADNNLLIKSTSNEVVNVKDFGAVPNDGLTDSVAVKAAIAKAAANGGGRVVFPIGVFNLPPIKIPGRVVLVGQGNGHASVDIAENNIRGTVLLVDGIAGKSDVDFIGNTSFSGLENLSVWNNNNASIEAVVKLGGVLYPHLTNVEISSVVHTTGAGLYLCGINTAPFFSTLYGDYHNVSVITNQSVGVRIGLELYGITDYLPPNASRFIGGHFQGYELSLLIDGSGANTGSQGVEFSGTAFESYYNPSQRMEFVQNSVGMQGFNNDSSRYGIVWIHLKRSNQVTFNGCYFEDGGAPFSTGYDDGVHGRHQVFPMLLLDTNAVQTTITGNTFVAGILDRGFGTTHPNKISFLDQNFFGTIESKAGPGNSPSQLSLGTNGLNGLTVIQNTSIIPRLRVSDFVIDTLNVLRKAGAALVLSDSNNRSSIETSLRGVASDLIIKNSGTEAIRVSDFAVQINKRFKLLPAEVPTISSASYDLVYDPVDSIVKKIPSNNATTITYGSTSTWDMSAGKIGYLTLAGNTTLTVTNPTANAYYEFEVTQDEVGGRLVNWPAAFKWSGGTAPALSTAAYAKDVVTCSYNGTIFKCNFTPDYR